MKQTLFVMIIGLPGSGKTTLAKKFHSFCAAEKCLLLDDLSLDFKKGVEAFDADDYSTVFITDPKMCGVDEEKIKHTIRKNFKCDVYYFDFFYFENDPEACIVNAQRDPKPGGTVQFIKHRSKTYNIPPDSKVYKVYRNEAAS